MNIKYPSWYYKSIDFDTLAEKEVEEMRLESEKIIEENKGILTEMKKDYEAMLFLASKIYGKNSLEMKYLNKSRTRFNPAPFDFRISILEKWAKAREAAEKKKKEEEKKQDAINLTIEAIVYLQAKGKVLDVDFKTGQAIEMANYLAYELEKERLISSGFPLSFNGQNCDDCPGWDGKDRRCECGNRRVSWTEGYGHSFKTPSVEAEAY